MLASVLFGAAILYALYRFVIAPVFFSPLSKIPAAHPTASFTPAWILWTRWCSRENTTVLAAHERLGPLIRLGPNEISVNCVNGGIRTVYTGGFEKGEWYSNAFSAYGGVHNMFSMEKRDIHSARKRMISNVYAKSSLQASPALREIGETILCGRMLPRIAAAPGGVLEAYELFSAVTLDVVTSYIFGLEQGSNFTDHPEVGAKWLHDYKSRQPYLFWIQEMPNVFQLFSKLGLGGWLIPDWVDRKSVAIEEQCLEWCDAAEAAILSGKAAESARYYPTVYGQLRSMLKKQEKSAEKLNSQLSQEQRLDLASEMLDHLAAGFDTSGITLTYLAWELSRPCNLEVQSALRKELLSIRPIHPPTSAESSTALPSSKELDELPLLHAVVMETLRLHAAIPGGQPRVTPATITLGPPGDEVHGIPAGVRVVSAAHSLHRNPEVFPEPGRWRPERWLDEQGGVDGGGEKTRWFWAFGSGGRMCVGSNLAVLEMKAIVALVWSNFETTVVDDAGMEHVDAYLAEPRGASDGSFLRLRCGKI
ncbi:putative cytochrome P450 monooxygenase [Aureobasidium namibiae CBS 147.97]|uniref:Putative cytochrome P450 monooxygenase n=1 Tax=Aureobasidium namibiae CBS 147.97 TaxID=1043004 RepID=A0A074WBR0_9PEZI